MKKMISFMAAVFVLCRLLTGCGKGEPVQWKDEKFRRLVYAALEKDDSETVTTKDLDKITQLFLLGDEQLHFSISVYDGLGRRNVGITDEGRIYIGDSHYEKCTDMSLEDLANFKNLVYITIYGTEYDNVDFAENMPDLVSINMYHCGVEDISGLADCDELEAVSFTFGGIEDISALEGKKKLTHIDLSHNCISDISPLSDLSLRRESKSESVWITLAHNRIKDISPLLGRDYQMWDKVPAYCYSYIDLSYNNISDLSPFANHTYVGSWVLGGNEITDAAPLLDLKPNPEKKADYNIFYLYDNPADSFHYLKDCPANIMFEEEKLEEAKPIEWQDKEFERMLALRLGKNPGEIYSRDLESIAHLYVMGDYMAINGLDDSYKGVNLATRKDYNDHFVLLKHINGKETEGPAEKQGSIKSIADLANFPNLVYYMINYQQIEDLDVPGAVPSVQSLILRNNRIKDISGIKNFYNVRSLNLACNEIEDITPLGVLELPAVHTLDLKRNRISDISMLFGLKEAGYVNLMMNDITDASPLADVDTISALYLDFNNISDISFLEKCKVYELHIQGNPIKDYSCIRDYTKVYGAG